MLRYEYYFVVNPRHMVTHPFLKRLPVLVIMMFCGMVCMHCRKGEHSTYFEIEGFDLTDASGISMGHVGPADNDWTYIPDFTGKEKYLLDTISANMEDTKETTVSAKIVCYPNPAKYIQYYTLNTADSCVFKMVITDAWETVVKTTAVKVKGFKTFGIDVSDRKLFKNGASFRVYYSFSAKDRPHFKKGYGDIKICDALGTPGASSCY